MFEIFGFHGSEYSYCECCGPDIIDWWAVYPGGGDSVFL
jgi:hypothetical protein